MTMPPSPVPAPPSARPQRGGVTRPLLAVLGASALVLAGYWLFTGKSSDATKAGGPQARRTAVAAAEATRRDVAVYFTGLGTVTPVQSVTVKSRVDGELQQVLFTEGQMVARGDLLAQIDPRPFQVQLTQAEGQLAKNLAFLENARRDLARYQSLAAGDYIAKQQADTQLALVRQYEGAIKSDQGVVDNAKLQLTYSRIVSPIDGRVGLRLVDPGNMVRAADPGGLLVVNQVIPITVVFTIPEDNLQKVLAKLAQGSPPKVLAYDREQKRLLAEGRLLTVDNQIDPSTGTVRLKAQFENKDLALFPNQFVNARLLVDVLAGAVTVPSAAIQRGPRGFFVYLITAENKALVRPVETGEVADGLTVVTKGLEAGELVVVDGADRLREGAPVEIKDPAKKDAAAKPEGKKAGQ